MPDPPVVSILTPSFNQGRWLMDNLRSVASQDHVSVEHIVMDGGSTDGSVDILRAARHDIRWRSEKDRGQSHALNKALRESRGDIIGWLNSDDAYFCTDAVSSAVRYFDEHPDVSVVYGFAALVDADGLLLHLVWVPKWNYGLLKLHSYIVQPTVFFRRSLFDDSLVDESYHFAMDRELWLRLGAEHRFGRIDRILAIDRHYPGRKSTNRDVLVAEAARLKARYGIPTGSAARLGAKVFKIPFRAMGATLIPNRPINFAFAAEDDGALRLARRQLTTRRSAMTRGMVGASRG